MGNVNIIDMWDERSMPVKADIDTTGTPPTDPTVPPQGDKYLWVTADYRRCGNPPYSAISDVVWRNHLFGVTTENQELFLPMQTVRR